MRPVNLLPAHYRPRTGGADGSKVSYIALGALAALVLAVFGYVMTANKVADRNSAIAQTRADIAAAESQAVTLMGFGDFAGVKQARLDAVKSLATARLDWERLFREMAHVLPEGVWLTGFTGNVASEDDGTSAEPGLQLKGCASDHRQIADVMVRLRELNAASDVELTKTATSQEGVAGAPAPTGASGADSESCGHYYSFELKVTLDVPAAGAPAATDQTVPARLGGGE